MAMRRRVVAALLATGCILAASGRAARAEDPEAAFETRVRPVLAGTCFKCHGGEKTSGGLRVDSREALLKGGDSRPGGRAGRPGGEPARPGGPPRSTRTSRCRRARGCPTTSRPTSPPGSSRARSGRRRPGRAGFALAAALGVRAGPRRRAAGRRPVRLGPIPIDRFLAGALASRGADAGRPADKRTLIRRLTFDLTGLPPTPEEVDAFLADDVARTPSSGSSTGCWPRRTTASAGAGTGSTSPATPTPPGDNADYPVPEAWRYRDYVIDAFNADKPYDQFVREQLAGDLLAGRRPAASVRRAGRRHRVPRPVAGATRRPRTSSGT